MTDRIEPTAKNDHNYGIDLLRIIAMLMIVLLHVLGQGGIIGNTAVFSFSYEITWLMKTLALCSVNCYALISGYVGVNSKHRYSNLATIWLQAVFYTVIITLLFFVFVPGTVGRGTLISALFPVMTNRYWYLSAYFVLILFSPLLNYAVNHCPKCILRLVLFSVLLFISVIFPFFNAVFGDPFLINNGYSALWLMILYLCGAYIRKHGLFIRAGQKALILIFLVSSALTWISKLLISLVTVNVIGEIRYDDMFVSYVSITTVASAASLLLLFSRMKISRGKRITALISSLTFGVYLINTNPLIFEHLLKDSFVWIIELPVYLMIPMILIVTILLFLACCVIDWFRYLLFKLLKFKPRMIQLEGKIIEKFS